MEQLNLMINNSDEVFYLTKTKEIEYTEKCTPPYCLSMDVIGNWTYSDAGTKNTINMDAPINECPWRFLYFHTVIGNITLIESFIKLTIGGGRTSI